MVKCIIKLDNNSRAVYCAGQTIKGFSFRIVVVMPIKTENLILAGTVELHLNHPRKFRGEKLLVQYIHFFAGPFRKTYF